MVLPPSTHIPDKRTHHGEILEDGGRLRATIDVGIVLLTDGAGRNVARERRLGRLPGHAGRAAASEGRCDGQDGRSERREEEGEECEGDRERLRSEAGHCLWVFGGFGGS